MLIYRVNVASSSDANFLVHMLSHVARSPNVLVNAETNQLKVFPLTSHKDELCTAKLLANFIASSSLEYKNDHHNMKK